MDPSLVHDEAVDTSATHAIVIGVGDYPHLPGGSADRPTDYHDGMGQLTSPPVSARFFARWLINEFHHPDKPLATVSMLLSESAGSDFTNPRSGSEYAVPRATLPAVKEAIRKWKDRGNSDSGNMLIFFYSGHGISQGPDTSLLLDDFGANEDNVLEGAIDFAGLHLGMARCAAKQQVYFIDACRASSDTLIEAFRYAGDPVILPNVREARQALAPVFYSTLMGDRAYGRTDKPSYFTESLLKALNGGGADDQDDDWRVNTTRLKYAIDVYMQREFDAGARRAQTPSTDNLSTFDFHFIAGAPPVEVTVGCSPDEATGEAVFDCRQAGNGIHERRDQVAEKPWQLAVPAGSYAFRAEFPTNRFQPISKQKQVRPPFRNVTLEVSDG